MAGERCSGACGWCGRCDADYRGLNATCPQCGADYHRNREDDGFLCDACCDARDAAREVEVIRMSAA